jgi:hypothetical protein
LPRHFIAAKHANAKTEAESDAGQGVKIKKKYYISMKKFSREQMIFALLVGGVILGITIYRYFFMF